MTLLWCMIFWGNISMSMLIAKLWTNWNNSIGDWEISVGFHIGILLLIVLFLGLGWGFALSESLDTVPGKYPFPDYLSYSFVSRQKKRNPVHNKLKWIWAWGAMIGGKRERGGGDRDGGNFKNSIGSLELCQGREIKI